jgi:DNA (cytosine-5)-methyltransferase 1
VEHLLPTPTARDGKGPNQRQDRTCLHGVLLPTPTASDGEKGGPNQRGSSGDLTLPSAVMPLLPTSTATDAKGGRNATAGRSNPDSNHHSGTTLTDVFWRWRGETTDPPSDVGS